MVMISPFRKISKPFLGCVFLFIPLMAQSQVTARGMGMGGAYTALARGVHAPDWNPANLGLPDNPAFSMSIIGIGAQLSNNSFTKSMYDKYSQKEYWDISDKADIFSSIPDNGFRAGLTGTVRILSFSVGKFALTMGGEAGGYANIEKTFFDILFYGNEIGKTYNFDDFKGGSEEIGLIGISYGEQIPVEFVRTFTVGASLNLLYGIYYANLEKADFKLVCDEFNFDLAGEFDFDLAGDFESQTAWGKAGWSLTLGTAAQVNEHWTLSLCLKNLVGNLSWSRDVTQNIGYFGGNNMDVLSFDDEEVFQDTSWTVEGNSFSTRLPVQLKAGSLYKENEVLLTLDYTQGFQTTAWTTTRPQFNFGTEWQHISWLPLRMGVLLGGRFGFGSAIGFGLRPGGFVWDVAIMNRGFITLGSSKGFVIATEIGIRL